MCGGPKNVTSTTNSEPPSYLAGPLRTAANASVNAFQGSGYQGGTPATYNNVPAGRVSNSTGFEGKFGNALNDVLGFPLGAGYGQGVAPGSAGTSGGVGNQLINQGQDLVSRTLGGQFLSPDSNPWLAQTFNRAADLTQTRLDSEFAGAGRNLGAAAPARSDELQTLAANIFGPAYSQERDRQTNALVSAQDYDDLNLLINRLAGITPGAGGKTTSTQPVFRTGLF